MIPHDLPDLTQTEYTIVIPYEQACALIRGEVTQDVRIACISGIKAMTESPAEFVTKPKRKGRAA